jgi:hypothetical protein
MGVYHVPHHRQSASVAWLRLFHLHDILPGMACQSIPMILWSSLSYALVFPQNVFIAVIIETFAEIRVQFQQMWGSRGGTADSDSSQVLCSDQKGWHMVTIDENKPRGLAPPIFQGILKTAWFHILILLLVLANAVTMATITFNHRKERENKFDGYYYVEVVFTALFDLEAIFKIWCLGLRGYFRRSIHKFELLLAVTTSLHIIPIFYRTQCTYFQVHFSTFNPLIGC